MTSRTRVAENGVSTNGQNGVSEGGIHLWPLTKSGALDKDFVFEDVTPTIGREFPTANIVDDLLNAINANTLLRDLAITSKFCPVVLPMA